MKKVIIPCENAGDLAIKIVEKTGSELASYEERRFPDGEFYFRLDSDVKNKEVVVVQSGYPHPNSSLIEMFLIVDTCKRAGAKKITLVVPYFPYARQDKIFKKGEAFSLRTMAKLLKKLGATKLITVDAHFRDDYKKYNLFGLDGINLSAGPELVKYLKAKFKLKNVHLISPDWGASEMIRNASKKTKSSSTVLKKVRKGDYNVEMSGEVNVKGKNVVVLDDIISTGGTMARAIDKAKKSGAKKVFAAATHGLFVGDALPLLKKTATYVVTTDSIVNETSEVTLAGEIAKALK